MSPVPGLDPIALSALTKKYDDWFEEKVTVPVIHSDGLTVEITRGEHVVSLMITNGGSLEVRGWGSMTHRNGHQFGLEQTQAFQLMNYCAFLEGLSFCGIDIFAKLYAAADDYVIEHGLEELFPKKEKVPENADQK